MKKILYIFSLYILFFGQNVFALPYAEVLENLSEYEKEIIQVNALKEPRSREIRQALISILNESSTNLTNLDDDIVKKRERLISLLKKPTDEESHDNSNSLENIVELDPILLRNKKELELSLILLETERKKNSLVNVYANDLLTQLSAITNQQNKKLLFNKATSLFSLKNWNTAAASAPLMFQTISSDILTWIGIVLAIGTSLIFVLGPLLYKLFQASYSNFMPTQHYPKWSFLLIFTLILISNCFYFVFIGKSINLELTFILLIFLNISLSIVLMKRLNDIKFVSRKIFIDGESVQQDRQFFTFFILVIKLLVIASVVASISGYVVLGMYTLHNIVITLTAITLFLCLRSLWVQSESKLLRSTENIDANQPKRSILLLTIVELVLAISLFSAAARFWGVSLNNFEGHSRLLRGEFQIGSLTIEINEVLSSVAAFLIVFYFFKLIRWFLRERIFNAVKVSVATSEAFVAIVSYVGFTFAIMASLNVLGVQWENLAIIAGALSVGIGFGLQTIFSNFVSGLILLFERPVRVGDWVILGNGLEGHIKKVNMRSTEILTLERSSVLIPNSNLLSDTITNWTLNDNIGRQDINIGVAYGSNTEIVEEVLLSVAAEHQKLRHYPAPQVLFKDFGDSSLDLTLRFFLRNINDRHQVSSDLRFAIDKAFRENNISIPFPQRDVNIKET